MYSSWIKITIYKEHVFGTRPDNWRKHEINSSILIVGSEDEGCTETNELNVATKSVTRSQAIMLSIKYKGLVQLWLSIKLSWE